MTAITINAKNRTIELTKTFATASSKFGSPEYEQLQMARKDYPNYKVVTITRKAPKSDKPTFKGLTYEYMEKYIKSHDNAEENMAEVFYISYEDGELIINSLYHDPDAEPYCEDCEDNNRSLHSYVCCVRGAGTFDHQGQSEVWHGECQREGPQDRQTADNEGRHPCHFLLTLSFFCQSLFHL